MQRPPDGWDPLFEVFLRARTDDEAEELFSRKIERVVCDFAKTAVWNLKPEDREDAVTETAFAILRQLRKWRCQYSSDSVSVPIVSARSYVVRAAKNFAISIPLKDNEAYKWRRSLRGRLKYQHVSNPEVAVWTCSGVPRRLASTFRGRSAVVIGNIDHKHGRPIANSDAYMQLMANAIPIVGLEHDPRSRSGLQPIVHKCLSASCGPMWMSDMISVVFSIYRAIETGGYQ